MPPCELQSWNAELTFPVASNVSTLKLWTASGVATGWYAELEAGFARNPPIYGFFDEIIGIECTLMLHQPKGADAQKPPLPVGKTVKMRAWVNEVASANVELNPLMPLDEGEASMISFYLALSMKELRSFGSCSGPVRVRIEIINSTWGTISSEITCILDTTRCYPDLVNSTPLSSETSAPKKELIIQPNTNWSNRSVWITPQRRCQGRQRWVRDCTGVHALVAASWWHARSWRGAKVPM